MLGDEPAHVQVHGAEDADAPHGLELMRRGVCIGRPEGFLAGVAALALLGASDGAGGRVHLGHLCAGQLMLSSCSARAHLLVEGLLLL